jgi:hypothetical protein
MNQTRYVDNIFRVMLSLSIIHLILVDMTILDEILSSVYISFYHATTFTLLLIWITIFIGVYSNIKAFPSIYFSSFYKVSFLVFLLFAVYFIEFVNVVFNNDIELVAIQSRMALLFSVSCLMIVSLFVIDKNNILTYLIKPYIYLVFIISTLSVSVFILILLGVVDVFDWHFIPIKNMEEGSKVVHNFYFPLYLSILQTLGYTIFGFPLLGVTGFSLDPHIGSALVFPAIFLTNYIKIRGKFFLNFIFLFYILISGSFTMYLICIFLLVVHMIFKFKSKFKVLILVIFTLLLGFLVISEMRSSEVNNSLFVKLNDASGNITKSLHINILNSEMLFGDPISKIKHTGFKQEVNNHGSILMAIFFYGFYVYSFVILSFLYFYKKEYLYLYAYGGLLIYTLKDPQLFFSSYINFMILVFLIAVYANNEKL